MKNLIKFAALIMLVLPLVLSSPSAFAKAGKGGHGREGGSFPSGFSKGSKKGWKGEHTPPGWTHGKKKGWEGEKTPPGLTEKAKDKIKEKDKES